MTTTILTTIGILLASAVAVMTVFYGGSFFRDGSLSAKATAVTNAGINIAAAYQTYELRNGRSPASLSALLGSALGDGLISRMPDVVGLGDVEQGWAMLNRGNGLERAFVVRNIPDDVCSAINKRVDGSLVIPTAPEAREGCYRGSNDVAVYYAFVGPSRPSDPQVEYVASPDHSG